MASGSSGWRTSGMRAKDSDRTETCQILDTALADGQLSMTEHGERVKSATSAATLGQLQELVADLQNAKTPQAPLITKVVNRQVSPPVNWGIRAAVAGVLVVVGIAIGWGLYGNPSSPLRDASDPGAQADGITPVVLTPPRQLHSLGGLTGLLEQMKQRFGDTTGYRLTVYPDYAALSRPDPTEDRRELNYSYRGGWDDPSSSSKSSDATVVDLSRFDVKTVVGVLRGAPETLGIKPADVTSTYLSIDPSRDPTTPGELSVSVYVSSDYGSGHIEMAPDGRVKRISYPS
ncbi:DUF1707 SHOCT-like domain-containing protein [Mycolicibacterium pulveris]|uniref:DUF1707 SHOCT-like domain-containing protein n=1 Tax=Mycolicibacterium pulveris TaxID=36813 RepID=UPI003CFA4342